MDLTFKREFSYYLLTIYVPCCMLVIVSWVSFWLDPNAVPARVSLGVTTLLTMSTQTASINNSLPPVAYTKAIDVWTGVSFFLWQFWILFSHFWHLLGRATRFSIFCIHKLPAACRLHQSHWCMDRGKFLWPFWILFGNFGLFLGRALLAETGKLQFCL